ncbi:hypothetical protein COCNU_11G002810 [Cocos nucifera]|uniref:PGG domain-containing protein n=1 Tax=Cocos nucifera TaxID=13894 RepID=A0A8K0N8Y5_COCNU|nr:hypothetical protein COCNU_11G002810 [Cocos nucifera]
MERDQKISQTSAIASVLVATVTFAAGFTVPGGYMADGTAVLAKEYAFKVFLLSDAFAFAFSTFATFWFVLAGTTLAQKHTRLLALSLAMLALSMAIASMCIAFGTDQHRRVSPCTGIVLDNVGIASVARKNQATSYCLSAEEKSFMESSWILLAQPTQTRSL